MSEMPKPIDFDGPFDAEGIMEGEFFIVECIFDSKREAKSWMLQRLRELEQEANTKPKKSIWKRFLG